MQPLFEESKNDGEIKINISKQDGFASQDIQTKLHQGHAIYGAKVKGVDSDTDGIKVKKGPYPGTYLVNSEEPITFLNDQGKFIIYVPSDQSTDDFSQNLEQFKELREQFNNVREILVNNQNRNQLNFDRIFTQQYELNNSLGEIYRAGIEEQEYLKKVFIAVQQQRIELGKVNREVESIRRWAKLAQNMGLPPDEHLRAAIENLALQIDNTGGLYQYLEVNLPLVPGLINYKVELGTDHKANIEILIELLILIWNSIKDWVK